MVIYSTIRQFYSVFITSLFLNIFAGTEQQKLMNSEPLCENLKALKISASRSGISDKRVDNSCKTIQVVYAYTYLRFTYKEWQMYAVSQGNLHINQKLYIIFLNKIYLSLVISFKL